MYDKIMMQSKHRHTCYHIEEIKIMYSIFHCNKEIE